MTTSPADALASLDLDAFSGVIRTARKPWRCICADPIRRFRVEVKCQHGTTWSTYRNRDEAEAKKAAAMDKLCHGSQFPDPAVTTVEIEEVPNPAYREDCEGDIPIGTVYLEYLGESATWESGTRYCSTCAVAVWSTFSR